VPQGQNYVTDPGLRSELMSKIRSEGTKVEVLVFKEMTSRGVTFQKHYPRALGKPDLAKPRKKLAVFLDGDFWHGRDLARIEAKHGGESAWALKLKANMNRDEKTNDVLRELGWDVLRVWESDVMRRSTRSASFDQIERFLRSRG
jgi:DNA mismatch endonuclease (patch repair protein)